MNLSDYLTEGLNIYNQVSRSSFLHFLNADLAQSLFHMCTDAIDMISWWSCRCCEMMKTRGQACRGWPAHEPCAELWHLNISKSQTMFVQLQLFHLFMAYWKRREKLRGNKTKRGSETYMSACLCVWLNYTQRKITWMPCCCCMQAKWLTLILNRYSTTSLDFLVSPPEEHELSIYSLLSLSLVHLLLRNISGFLDC